jgi:hypothetical protein
MTAANDEARTRVEEDPALLEYRYFLLDDPLLYGSIWFERSPSRRAKTELEAHYRWVCKTDTLTLLEWAVAQSREFREFLRERTEEFQSELTYFSNKTENDKEKRVLQGIQELVDNIQLNRNLTEAANFLFHAIRQLERYVYLNPLIERGQKELADSRRGHNHTYGEAKEKRKKYQPYIEELRKASPRIPLSETRKIAAKFFKVSVRTIERYTNKPT